MSEKTTSQSAAGSGTISLGGELTVNRLGFGAMRLTGDGIWGPPKDRATAIAVLRRAIELGVNFIDTADSYGPYVSEELIADALAPYPKDLVIATKGGWNRPGPNQWTHDASPAHLREAVEGSLKRLRLDRIDVYQLHVPDPAVPLAASIETLANMQSEGQDPVSRIVECHGRAHRARSEDRPDRIGPEPVQFCRSRMGQCRRLLRAQQNRVHPVVPAGSRARSRQAAGTDCEGSPSKTHPDRIGLVAEAIPGYVTHPRDFLDCSSRGKPTGSVVAII